MADIFKNIGKLPRNILQGIGGIDRFLRAPMYSRLESAELQKELRLLQSLPQGSQAQIAMARKIMDKHGPEIMKTMGPEAYQSQQDYGTLPGAYQFLTKEEQREAAKRYGGLEPRATDPWAQLGKMADVEANLGVDPATGKPRWPALTKQIGEQIGGFQLPGMQPPAQPSIDIDSIRKQAADYLKEEPSKPTAPGFMTKLGLGVDKVAGKAIDVYQGLERGVDRAFRKQPRTGTMEARVEAAIAEGKWEEALMWMHWGPKHLSQEVGGRTTRLTREGYSAESIVKAIRSFPDPSKITVKELNKRMQNMKTGKADPLGIR